MCALLKNVLQMHVLVVKLVATVEPNFNTYTGYRLKIIDNYHSIHSHSIHLFSGCILTWTQIVSFRLIIRYVVVYRLFNHSFNLNVTLFTIIIQHNILKVALKRPMQLCIHMNCNVRLQFMNELSVPRYIYANDCVHLSTLQ